MSLLKMLRGMKRHIQFTCKQPRARLWDGWYGLMHFVPSQGDILLVPQIPKLFTFPHPTLSRENIANSAGDAENIKGL